MQKLISTLTATAVVEYVYCPAARRMVPRAQASQPGRPTNFWIHAN